MSRVEVLLATMQKQNTDFLKDMNIQTDIVVANQADTFAYSESTDERGNRVRFVTTAFRGLSNNRNLAFAYASGEFLLMADDDLHYKDDLESTIATAFEQLPRADIIVFNTDNINLPKGRDAIPKNERITRVNAFNFARYGSCCIGLRHSSLKLCRIKMSEYFGAGSGQVSCGEDSVFLRDALRAGMKIYTYPATVSVIDQSSSSWFGEYDEKFMFDKGAVCGTLYPVWGFLFKYYFALKFSRKSELGLFRCIGLMRKGMKCAKKGLSYTEYKEGKR